MKEFYKNFLANNLYFWVFGGIALVLIIASWFVPPMAVIDGSVLAATGEIFGFTALGAVVHAIDTGKTATIQHGNTTVTVKDVDGDGSGEGEDILP